MLAQGQSSSAKRGGLAVVSSGLIFLKKKKSPSYVESWERLPGRNDPVLSLPREGREVRNGFQAGRGLGHATACFV